jgi:uncharacterized protein YecE (DUF72 family)
MAKIYIGTSGWSYPTGEGTWNGHFYPAGKINELEYYSRFFNTVEVNSSFYRPPNPAYAENWAKKTPDGFMFAVKLWQKFTHPKMYQQVAGENGVTVSQADIDLFRDGIEPLAARGKLGPLLAQFPPSFTNDTFNRNILLAIFKSFKEYRLAVELRHKSWSDDKNTEQILRENKVAWVQIDEPKFSSSIEAELPITSDVAYFRFHGRNREMWWKGDVETRYKYLYSAAEITELTNKIKLAAEKTQLLFAFFNNHWQGYAPKNATDMKTALQLTMSD